jgi:hypothetical protein
MGMQGLGVALADSDSERAIKIHQSDSMIASIIGFEALSHVFQLA